jgi:uncharacterized protein YcaQ
MAQPNLPTPSVTLGQAEARRFLLAHQRLWPPRRLHGKAGILEYIRHVGCIQFDPINVVGQNPDLVLQARVADYDPEQLQELLYGDRGLLDGWDKAASIYPVIDWPCFGRHRAAMRRHHGDPSRPAMQIAPEVLQAIRERGPLSSIDLKHDEQVDWAWGPTRVARAALESLYAMGQLGVHHRVGTRRAFDLIERLLPAELLATSDPHATQEAYEDWHVLRRVGGLGLADVRSSEYWLGIRGVKARERRAALARLVERGDLVAVALEGEPSPTLFLRTTDLPTLEAVQTQPPSAPEAAILGALDNLLWDRKLAERVFDFAYVWEVYKPVAQRRYGYYVLPVLYGDRFVARFDPALDRRSRQLTITNWWWQEGVSRDASMEAALAACMTAFARYLHATSVERGEAVRGNPSLAWLDDVEAA